METPSACREPIKESLERTVEFPEKDESTGELMINYMGPSMDNLLESKVCIHYPIMLCLYSPRHRQSKFLAHTSRPLLLPLSIKSS
jgi:hypothetical protein